MAVTRPPTSLWMRPAQFELSARWVSHNGQAAVGGVVRVHHDRSSECLDLGGGDVGVVDLPVERPVGRYALGEERGCVPDPRQLALASGVAHGRVPELIAVTDDVG